MNAFNSRYQKENTCTRKQLNENYKQKCFIVFSYFIEHVMMEIDLCEEENRNISVSSSNHHLERITHVSASKSSRIH
jgi:hypothetical protein